MYTQNETERIQEDMSCQKGKMSRLNHSHIRQTDLNTEHWNRWKHWLMIMRLIQRGEVTISNVHATSAGALAV